MIRVLIADDNRRKVDAVIQTLHAFVAEENLIVEVATTANDATQAMTRQRFDLLIIDLKLPVRRGEPARSDGGMTVMIRFKKRGGAIRPGHIVGLTAFDDLRDQYRGDFEASLWHLVKYEESSNDWAEKLWT